jgi:hypothetical protein
MLVAHIAEIDARRLYVPAAYPSMYLYCVHELHLSEGSAYKRIQAARTARQFPAIFDALAEGYLHLTAVNLLAPYLTPENAEALLEAAGHKTTREIEQVLAERFPRSEMLPLVQAIPSSPPLPGGQRPPELHEACASDGIRAGSGLSARRVAPIPGSNSTPVAPERFLLQLTVAQSTHDKLQYLKELLSHQVPSGDLAEVLERTFDIAIRQLEMRKFAATSRARRSQLQTTGWRHIPARVKLAVWERDGGRCTFMSASGHRCGSRRFLEFDHRDPVALGGQATVEQVQLRCRTHNQFAAECAFGAQFMKRKRDEARARAGRGECTSSSPEGRRGSHTG